MNSELVTFGANTLVGATSGGLAFSIVYPLDTIKTNMQNASKMKLSVSLVGSGTGTATAETTIYNGVFDCVQKLYKVNGLKTFYNGLRPTLIGILPEKAIKLAANDFFRSFYGSYYMGMNLATYRADRKVLDTKLPMWLEACAGGSAGLFQVIATNPMELIKISRQLTPLSTVEIIKELGIRGLYTKVHATLLRDIPFSMLYFTMYSRLKQQLTNKTTGELTVYRIFAASVAAGGVAAFVSTPLDTVKTRVQARNSKYTGVFNCILRTYKEEGWRTFFNGSVARVSTISLLFGFTLIFYEYQKSFMRDRKSVV